MFLITPHTASRHGHFSEHPLCARSDTARVEQGSWGRAREQRVDVAERQHHLVHFAPSVTPLTKMGICARKVVSVVSPIALGLPVFANGTPGSITPDGQTVDPVSVIQQVIRLKLVIQLNSSQSVSRSVSESNQCSQVCAVPPCTCACGKYPVAGALWVCCGSVALKVSRAWRVQKGTT